MNDNADIADAIAKANEIAGSGRPVIVAVKIDYSRKTAFTVGTVKTNFGRFPLNEKLRFLTRAADVEEIHEFRQWWENPAAITQAQLAIHNFEQRETAEVMTHASRRLRLWLRVGNSERRPLDFARGSTGGYQPVIA